MQRTRCFASEKCEGCVVGLPPLMARSCLPARGGGARPAAASRRASGPSASLAEFRDLQFAFASPFSILLAMRHEAQEDEQRMHLLDDNTGCVLQECSLLIR